MPEDFMSYQLQQNGPTRRRRQPVGAAQPPAQTPFMPNGQPQPAAPVQPSQPAQPAQPAQQQQPAAPQPPPGMEGWVSYGNGGWAPPGHAAAQGQPAAAPAAQPAVVRPPVDPRMGQQGSVDAKGVYTAGQAPTQTYQAQAIPRFQAPDLASVQQPHMELIKQLLSNPTTMGPQQIDQLKGREQDAASLMERQARDQMLGNFASRGISADSGYAQGRLAGLGDATSRGLLNSYRDIDINAIGQNRQDLMQAIGAGDQFQNNALQRAISAYDPTLAGMGQQRTENTTALDSLYNRFGMQEGMLGNQAQSLQQAISGQRAADLEGNAQANAMRQFSEQMGFNRDQFGYQKEQNSLERSDRLTAQEQARQQAASAASAANDRWVDSQAMAYQQQQEDEWNTLMAIMMNGGGGF